MEGGNAEDGSAHRAFNVAARGRGRAREQQQRQQSRELHFCHRQADGKVRKPHNAVSRDRESAEIQAAVAPPSPPD